MLEAVEKVTSYFPDLTQEDRASRLSSGINRWRNRVQWVRQHLIENGELDGSVRGIWKVTPKGKGRFEREWSSWKPAYSTEHQREEWEKQLDSEAGALREWAQGTDTTPQEVLEDMLDNMNEAVGKEILQILLNLDPSSFESIIGQLLGKMGYGDIRVTGRSGDGGIDGTCSTDALGLYKLHYQAKRWKNQVGASEIRDFIGGIQTSRGEYGIFVTASDFSKDAVETAMKSGKVKLVNGDDLAALMIKYELGVTNTPIHVAKIDRDYFDGL